MARSEFTVERVPLAAVMARGWGMGRSLRAPEGDLVSGVSRGLEAGPHCALGCRGLVSA